MKTYVIKNWEEHYENNRSKTVKDLAWVKIPNRHDGEHYSRLMLHEDASKIFSAWILLIQVASRCHPRGSLLRSDGQAHDSESLAIKTRAPCEWFDIAIPNLIQMGWLAQIETERQETVSVLPASCQRGDEERRNEGKEGMEGMTASLEEESFNIFWKAYPRKEKRSEALKLWKSLKPSVILRGLMLKVIAASKTTKSWKDDGGRFIPLPSTWLEDERWTDEIQVTSNPITKPTGAFAGQ